MAGKFKIKIPAPRKKPSGQGRVPHVVTPKVKMGQRRIYSKETAATGANPMSFPWGGFGNTGLTGED
jgi:hypothetical protein